MSNPLTPHASYWYLKMFLHSASCGRHLGKSTYRRMIELRRRLLTTRKYSTTCCQQYRTNLPKRQHESPHPGMYLKVNENRLRLLQSHSFTLYNYMRNLNCYCTNASKSSTIFSLSSGYGKCGVAVIRVSGPAAVQTLREIGQFKESVPQPREATVRHLVDPTTGVVIDKGLVLYFPGKISACMSNVLNT